jgi:aminopeptidase N
LTEDQPATNGFLLRDQSANLPIELSPDHALKLNVADAGYYRVEYDESSWKLILGQIDRLSEADRVNLLIDAWALVEANRKPLLHYFALVKLVLRDDQLAVYDQVIDTLSFINRLFAGDPVRPAFQQFARLLLGSSFDRVGWDPKPGEPGQRSFLRGSLIRGLGLLNDSEIIAGCRSRFDQFASDPNAIPPDLRADILGVVGRYADSQSWEKLHRFGLKTNSTEEKQFYYEALASAIDPRLAPRTMAIALSDELPTSRAAILLPYFAIHGEHPELVWEFGRTHMKELLAKQDALGINSFAPSLVMFSSSAKDAEALQNYAKTSLPDSSSKEVAKAVDEIEFRVEFKERLRPQLKSLIESQNP